MISLKQVYLFSVLLVCSFLTNGQSSNLSYEHITVEQGLSNNTVNAIIQDTDGFMWFGTWDGLCRYDGYSFKIFRPEKGNPHSISSNVIRTLLEDKDGVLWIGTENGLNRYNPDTESFVSYVHNPSDTNSLSYNLIYNIFEDKQGLIWIGTRGGGVDIFNKETKIFSHPFKYLSDTTPINKNIFSIVEDNKGDMLFGLDGYSHSYNINTNRLTEERSNGGIFSAIAQFVDKENNILWSGSWGRGLLKRDLNTGEEVRFVANSLNVNDLSNNIIMVINEVVLTSGEKEIWIGTREGGLNIYNKQNSKFTAYISSINNNKSISDNIILSIYQDRTGIVWVGTKMGGVNKININKKKFKTIKPSNLNSSYDNKIMSVCEGDDNNIWMGTGNSGVLQYDRGGSKIRQYSNKIGEYDFNSSPVNVVKYFESQRGANLQIGGDQNRFYSFFTHKKDNPTIFLDTKIDVGDIYSLCIDSNRTWIGSYGSVVNTGFGYFDSITKKYKSISLPDSWGENLYLRVFAIVKSKYNNVLWLGTRGNGFAKYDIDKDEFVFYTSQSGSVNSLSHDDVYCIYEDEEGLLWVGTGGGGLNSFDTKTLQFNHYTKDDGLPSNVIYGILEDDNGNLWLSTTYGISKFNKENNKFCNYNTEDGLLDNVFNYGAFYKSKGGEMFFGGLNGLTSFFPDSIINNVNTPTVNITKLKIQNTTVGIGDEVNERVVLTRSITKTGVVSLKYSDRSFTLEFSAMDFAIPSKNRYAYKLEGFDNSWLYVDASSRSVNYTNLNAGKYVFKVKASNNDNIWSKDVTELMIVIYPPFWETIWFRSLVALLLLLFFVLFYKLRTDRLKSYQDKLENEVRSRTAEIIMQKEEIEVQSEGLYSANEMLRERQIEIEEQSGELSKLNSTKDKLFSIIAHDLKNPFHGIISFSELLMSKSHDISKEQQIEFIDIIHKSSTKASELLDSLLQWSQTQTGSIEINQVSFDINEAVNGVICIFDSLAKNKEISLVNLTNEKILVFADKDMINTVIRNLVSNAIKFTHAGGGVEVSVRLDSHFVAIEVKDSGVGLSLEDQKNIFKIDVHHSKIGTSGQKGTGLGLVICKEFVEKNSGKLTVNSELLKGTTFSFTIPTLGKNRREEIVDVKRKNDIEELSVSCDIKEIGVDDVKFNNKRPIVLIADDNSHVRLGIKEFFANTFQILEAVDGAEALNLAIDILPDLVISDVVMPKINGVELCDKLKSDIRTSHIPVVLLTSKSTVEDKLLGLGKGADDYITKPFDLAVLKIRAINLIKQRLKLQELFGKNKPKEVVESVVNTLDDEFILKIISSINNNISNNEFSVNDLLVEIGMSNSQLYRKLMAITGQSANEFIRNHRLRCAVDMLKEEKYSVSEIAYEVGFSTPSYFTKCFKKYYGISPTDYR